MILSLLGEANNDALEMALLSLGFSVPFGLSSLGISGAHLTDLGRSPGSL